MAWVRKRSAQGAVLDANLFTQAKMDCVLERSDMDEDVKANAADKPNGFKSVHWVSWKELFENYLSSLKGHNNVPLTYVI